MSDDAFPEGQAFLDLVARGEEACVRLTAERVGRLGTKAPECRERLGNLLSLLYREACCFYGCAGGDHFGQHIAARVVNHSLGSYRLLCAGYYDESLALTRNLGETANLFFLFLHRPQIQEEWRRADMRTRKRDFSPFRVRSALEQAGIPVPIDEKRYGGLCEVAVHVTPHTMAQVHNARSIPTLGSYFQERGALAALNELAGATAVCAASLVAVLDVGERKPMLNRATIALLRSVGGVDLSTLRDRLDAG